MATVFWIGNHHWFSLYKEPDSTSFFWPHCRLVSFKMHYFFLCSSKGKYSHSLLHFHISAHIRAVEITALVHFLFGTYAWLLRKRLVMKVDKRGVVVSLSSLGNVRLHDKVELDSKRIQIILKKWAILVRYLDEAWNIFWIMSRNDTSSEGIWSQKFQISYRD